MAILKQHEAGVSVAELAREHGISAALIYQCRSKYEGMNTALMKRLKDLESENARLKNMYAQKSIKADLRQEALEGKVVRPSRRKAMVKQVVERDGMSFQFACKALGIG